MNWKDALSYCENLTLAGKDNWRLPTVKELASIVRPDKYNPAIDTLYFPKIASSYYWSSDSCNNSPEYAWYVYFSKGYVDSSNKGDKLYARCVSDRQPRQFDDSVISDVKTELSQKIETTKPLETFLSKKIKFLLPKLESKENYYALIIGNNNYKDFPPLKTAIQDATDVADILKKQYNFQIRLLLDATRTEIVTALNDYREILKQDDYFLIYYAGHGTFDNDIKKAYWLPVNAEPSNNTEWIIADTITSNIKKITSKHILIVADNCYSGTLTRGKKTNLRSASERERYLKKMMEKPSRTLIASGGNEPVLDEGGKGHSVFAQAFIDGLNEMEQSIFLAEELFYQHIKEQVAGNVRQIPEYQYIQDSGHDGGDFIFVRRGSEP